MKMKNWMRNAGFTLVELIVVIAVLGVLGAGAAVGYSGYTKKAAKAADEQLAAQIKYALEVAQVSDPMPNGAAALVLSKTAAATVSPASTPAAQWVSNAMANAFGDNWTNELKLQYGEWGKGSAFSAKTLSYFGKVSDPANTGDGASVKYDAGIAKVLGGKAVPTFADNVDDLFLMIRDLSGVANKKLEEDSAAGLVQGAAKYTMLADTKADDFATACWSSPTASAITSLDDDACKNNKISANDINLANWGVVKARNVALACYLRKEGVAEDFCKEVENYSIFDDHEGHNVPIDFAAAAWICDSESELAKKMNAVDTSMLNYIGKYFNKEINKGEPTQAYLDGLAYYTMMSTVNALNDGTVPDDDTYWDEVAGAVSLGGSIARGDTTLAELRAALENAGAEGDVSVAVMAGQKGLVVKFSPLTIAP